MKSVQLVVVLGLFVAGTIASIQHTSCSMCSTDYTSCYKTVN